MFAADVVEYLSRWASASVGYVIKALTDTLHGVGTGRNVEQALIGLGINLRFQSAGLDIRFSSCRYASCLPCSQYVTILPFAASNHVLSLNSCPLGQKP
jgi:hypothetical protein